jgi:hypothetical protein
MSSCFELCHCYNFFFLGEVSTTCFWSYCDKNSAIIFTTYVWMDTIPVCMDVIKSYYRTAILIIISAERRLLLDIGLSQSSPWRSVLCCPHPATSRDLHQIVGPPCGGPTNAASPGTRSPFDDLSAPMAVSPPHNVPYPLPLDVCNSSGYVGDLSSFTDVVISDSIT